MANLQTYQNMVFTAEKNLSTHKGTAQLDMPVTDPAWVAWIKEYKRLSSKLADADIALLRYVAMEKQGVNDVRFR